MICKWYQTIPTVKRSESSKEGYKLSLYVICHQVSSYFNCSRQFLDSDFRTNTVWWVTAGYCRGITDGVMPAPLIATDGYQEAAPWHCIWYILRIYLSWILKHWGRNTMAPFTRRRFQMQSLEWQLWILIVISLKFVSHGPNNNIPALVQIMACRRLPMMVSLLTHKCFTRHQWGCKQCSRSTQIVWLYKMSMNSWVL